MLGYARPKPKRLSRKFGKSLRRHVLAINKAIATCSSRFSNLRFPISGGFRWHLVPSYSGLWPPSTGIDIVMLMWNCGYLINGWTSIHVGTFSSHLTEITELYGLGRIRLLLLLSVVYFITSTRTFLKKKINRLESTTFIFKLTSKL